MPFTTAGRPPMASSQQATLAPSPVAVGLTAFSSLNPTAIQGYVRDVGDGKFPVFSARWMRIAPDSNIDTPAP